MSDDRLIRALSVLHRKGETRQHQSLDEYALAPSADSLLRERPLAETALLPVEHEPVLEAGAQQVLPDSADVIEAGRALLDLRGGHESPVGQAQTLQEAHAVGVPAMHADSLVPSPPPALPLAPIPARAADESHAVMAKLADEPGPDSTAQSAVAATAAVPAPSAVNSAPGPGRLRAADDQQGADAGARAPEAAAVASNAEAADSTESGARKAAGESGYHGLAHLEEQNRILHELGIYS